MIRLTSIFLGLVAAVMSSAGCSVHVVGQGTCTSNGHVYHTGETISAPGDCNICVCDSDGTLRCTTLHCPSPCTYQGMTYSAGVSFPAGDGCNTCSCEADGMVVCTRLACAIDCTYQGQTYPPGVTFPAPDGCNTCQCQPDGTVLCGDLICPPSCVYAGASYPVGASYPALDGCNTCTCQPDGTSACTKLACACDASKEWWRHYVGTSPAACAVIDPACPANTTGFTNDCGCGCEQAASCPEIFDCMPPKSCDVAALKAMCPFSTIGI
jgi:hypothetical protein